MAKKRAGKSFSFIMKDIRCFAGEQEFKIRPLTFLTGENSAGKTTVLGCFSAIYNLISGSRAYLDIDFNKEPYFFGSFKDIVRRSGKAESGKFFELGFKTDAPKTHYRVSFRERDKGEGPEICRIDIHFKDIQQLFDNTGKKPAFTIKSGAEILKSFSPNESEPVFRRFMRRGVYPFMSYFMESVLWEKTEPPSKTDNNKKLKQKLRLFEDDLWHYNREFFSDNTKSIAPVRSKPKRIYNPVEDETPNPEGKEIPVLFMRLSGKKEIWKDLRQKLIRFGKASGLFSDIEVKRYGKSLADPFQLELKVRGPKSNIMDTGYGVSQILPVLAQLFHFENKGRSRRFLLQQPEVHLHPKAQAELASLFVSAVKENKSFLIETHSDNMIDRTRIEIRKGNISPDDVSLIYLESVKSGAKAHNISFDDQGNLLNVPKGYRDFFLKETDRVLGFRD